MNAALSFSEGNPLYSMDSRLKLGIERHTRIRPFKRNIKYKKKKKKPHTHTHTHTQKMNNKTKNNNKEEWFPKQTRTLQYSHIFHTHTQEGGKTFNFPKAPCPMIFAVTSRNPPSSDLLTSNISQRQPLLTE